MAGIVLTTLLVPQGMAYAELAGLPPITGLHTSILCLLAYAVFGPSRILVLGPASALGPMIAAGPDRPVCSARAGGALPGRDGDRPWGQRQAAEHP
jgi:MFS superfamily sulfate permease-like transporter